MYVLLFDGIVAALLDPVQERIDTFVLATTQRLRLDAIAFRHFKHVLFKETSNDRNIKFRRPSFEHERRQQDR